MRSAANLEVRGAGLIRLRLALRCLARHAAEPPLNKHERKAKEDGQDELLEHGLGESLCDRLFIPPDDKPTHWPAGRQGDQRGQAPPFVT